MIRLGLIGLSEHWEPTYAAALDRFRTRFEISTVFAPISARAAVVARELGARTCDGILATAESHEVDALLVLDVGRLGIVGVQLAASAGKPMLVATPTLGRDEDLRQLARAANDHGHVLVPALARRYAPATARLRELVATSIGPPREIVLRNTVSCGSSDARLVELFDWCGYVGQSTARSVTTEPLNGRVPQDLEGCRVRLEFAAPGREAFTANVENRSDDANPLGERPLEAEVGCARGRVRIQFPHTIVWSSSESEPRTEVLSDERPEFDVMLDQFLRRVVGGLVPVPDLNDVRRGLRIGLAARESLRSGLTVSIEGDEA